MGSGDDVGVGCGTFIFCPTLRTSHTKPGFRFLIDCTETLWNTAMPRHVSPATIVYSRVGRGVGGGMFVSVAIGSGVNVFVGVVVGVSDGVRSLSLPMRRVAAYVKPAASKEKITRSKRARGRVRVTCAGVLLALRKEAARSTLPHTSQCVAFSRTLVPQIGHTWRLDEGSCVCSVMFISNQVCS